MRPTGPKSFIRRGPRRSSAFRARVERPNCFVLAVSADPGVRPLCGCVPLRFFFLAPA